MTGSLWPPRAAGQDREAAAAPALLPSGYLLAALALLLVAPSALAGWVAGAVVVGSGRVSRGRLAAAASVTGTLALLAVGPTVAAGDLLGAITTLSGVAAGHLDRWGRAGGPERDLGPWAGAGHGHGPGRGRHRHHPAQPGPGRAARVDGPGAAPPGPGRGPGPPPGREERGRERHGHDRCSFGRGGQARGKTGHGNGWGRPGPRTSGQSRCPTDSQTRSSTAVSAVIGSAVCTWHRRGQSRDGQACADITCQP
jgi:hypothetical protein